jgi:hypothetical protein
MVYAPVILAALMMISAFVSPHRIPPKLDQVELIVLSDSHLGDRRLGEAVFIPPNRPVAQ